MTVTIAEPQKAIISADVKNDRELREMIPSHHAINARRAAIVKNSHGDFLVFKDENVAKNFAVAFGNKEVAAGSAQELVTMHFQTNVEVPSGQVPVHIASFDKRTNRGEAYIKSEFRQGYKDLRHGYGIKLEGTLANADLWKKAVGCNSFASENAYSDAVAKNTAHRQ